jgi:hypothetical protein
VRLPLEKCHLRLKRRASVSEAHLLAKSKKLPPCPLSFRCRIIVDLNTAFISKIFNLRKIKLRTARETGGIMIASGWPAISAEARCLDEPRQLFLNDLT